MLHFNSFRMKSIKNMRWVVFMIIAVLGACKESFLDREPISEITPANYLTNESHLAAYTIDRYGPTNGWNIGDPHTDNQAAIDYSTIFAPGEWRVQSSGGWDFGALYQCNYFFETVLPRFKSGRISGSATNIAHYIGEMYFFRAQFYFDNLKTY